MVQWMEVRTISGQQCPQTMIRLNWLYCNYSIVLHVHKSIIGELFERFLLFGFQWDLLTIGVGKVLPMLNSLNELASNPYHSDSVCHAFSWQTKEWRLA